MLQFFCSFEFSVPNSGFGENLAAMWYFDSKDSAFLSIFDFKAAFWAWARQLKIALQKRLFFHSYLGGKVS
jgi:hypothetical protein